MGVEMEQWSRVLRIFALLLERPAIRRNRLRSSYGPTGVQTWRRRSEATFLYVFYLYLLAAFPIGVLAVFAPEAAQALAAGAGAWLAAVPRELWAAFLAGYLGCTGLRSLEKIRGLDV